MGHVCHQLQSLHAAAARPTRASSRLANARAHPNRLLRRGHHAAVEALCRLHKNDLVHLLLRAHERSCRHNTIGVTPGVRPRRRALVPRRPPPPPGRVPLTLSTGFLFADSGMPCCSPSSYSRRKWNTSTGPSPQSAWKKICRVGMGRPQWLAGPQAKELPSRCARLHGCARASAPRTRAACSQRAPGRPFRTRPTPPLSAQKAARAGCAGGC